MYKIFIEIDSHEILLTCNIKVDFEVMFGKYHRTEMFPWLILFFWRNVTNAQNTKNVRKLQNKSQKR